MTSQQDTELDQESEHALILETAYNLGYHKIKDGCLQEPLKELNKLISSKVKEAYERGIQDGLISVQQDILDKVGKGSYRLQGKGVESGALTVRDDISLKLSKLDQLSKEIE